jgi:hypothetical protein
VAWLLLPIENIRAAEDSMRGLAQSASFLVPLPPFNKYNFLTTPSLINITTPKQAGTRNQDIDLKINQETPTPM